MTNERAVAQRKRAREKGWSRRGGEGEREWQRARQRERERIVEKGERGGDTGQKINRVEVENVEKKFGKVQVGERPCGQDHGGGREGIRAL